jgi:tetratricopeptide (TPR) repeat protein
MHKSKVFSFLIMLAFFYFPEQMFGQEKMSSAQVEEKSYDLYLHKSWKELAVLGNNAIKQGYDYYYLRMRIGCAYYEQGNYLSADKQFKKALEFSSGDPTAEEYLYFCYIYIGRYEEARKLSKLFTKELARKIGTDSLSAVSFVIIEGGVKTSDSSTLFHNATYAQAGLGHYVNNSFSLFHAVTYYTESEFRGKTSQFQYYLLANVPMKNDWLISPAFQWIYRENTPPPVQEPPPVRIGPRPPPPPAPSASSSNYFIGSLQARKKLGHFYFTIGGTISNIDSNAQYMQAASISYFPFGNSRLIIGTQGYLVESGRYGNETAISPFVSCMPFKSLTLSASYLNSSVYHLIEGDGYIVNNSFDLTPSRWTFQCSVSLSKNLSVYGLYQLENKVESIANFKYNYQAFIIGLKFIP